MGVSVFAIVGLKTPVHAHMDDITPSEGSNINEYPKSHVLA